MQTDCFRDTPAEWDKGPVSRLALVNPRYPVRKNVEYPFIEMASVAEQFGGILQIESRKLEGSGLTRFKAKDTLFAKITPCPQNGKVAFVKELPADVGLGSTEFIVLSPVHDASPRFVYHLVCSHEVRGRASARMEGSTGRQRVPEEVFGKRLLVPIPSLAEQSAIACILDAVDAAIGCSSSALDEVHGLKRAILRHFFYDALGETAYADRPYKALPEGWKLMPTGELLAEEPKNGISPKASSQPPGVPTFSIAAVRNGRVDLSGDHLKYAKLGDKLARKFQVARGDLLVVRGNANPNLVGKAGMIADFPRGCIYPDITKRVVFKTEGEHTVTPEYAVLAWNHPIVHNQIVRRAKTSNGTLKINTRDVKQIILPVPPEQAQKDLVALVAAVEAKSDALKEKLTALKQLKKSLMHDLLTGKVRVSQNFQGND